MAKVKGHEGQLVFGKLNGVPVVVMRGRFHPYEGHAAWRCALPVRLMKLMGVRLLMLTNASGGLNPRLKVGDIVLLKDHISVADMMGISSLRGPNDERWGPRFPSINRIYDLELRKLFLQTAQEHGLGSIISEGIYCYQGGPSYETVTEVRFMRDALKGDVVGMSTAYEALTASHCGMKVIGFSLVSDLCIMEYDCEQDTDHESVIAEVEKRVPDVKRLIEQFFLHLKETEFAF